LIGLALSGGGSRAIAFHLGCLRALHDLDLLKKVQVLSTISGGSIIGAYYAYSPNKSFEEFDVDIQKILREGLQRQIATELFQGDNFFRGTSRYAKFMLANLWSKLVSSDIRSLRYPTRTDMFHSYLNRNLFKGLKLESERRENIDIVIGATELRTGSAFRFGNEKSGSYRYGELVKNTIDVSLAVAASAAYPLLLPSIERDWKFIRNGIEKEHRIMLTDGGVYDNLGTQVLEPERDKSISIHTYDLKGIIACNAGAGLEAGDGYPQSYVSRVTKAFELIHRRVQDASMNRLHVLRREGRLNAFIMPYLGQKDVQLPFKPMDLVPRDEVANYPTNFAPMKDHWIEKLSKRGEQLTRLLVSQYFSL